jgi:hypothetical protein
LSLELPNKFPQKDFVELIREKDRNSLQYLYGVAQQIRPEKSFSSRKNYFFRGLGSPRHVGGTLGRSKSLPDSDLQMHLFETLLQKHLVKLNIVNKNNIRDRLQLYILNVSTTFHVKFDFQQISRGINFFLFLTVRKTVFAYLAPAALY